MYKIFISILAILSLTSCSTQNSQLNVPNAPIVLDGEIKGESTTPTPSSSASLETEPPVKQKPVFDPSAEIEVDDQSGDGTLLEIDEVEFSLNQVWLIVRSKSGELFHSELLSYGIKKVNIQMNVPLVTGKYIASLHNDNGDRIFDSSVDLILREEEDELVREDFDFRKAN